MLGRDAQDTQRVARRWRLLAYRDPPRSSPDGAPGTGRARSADDDDGGPGGRAGPAGGNGRRSVPDDDAVLVTRHPDVEPLEVASPDQVSDQLLEELRQVAHLPKAGIAHGRLNASNVLVVEDEPMLVDFSAATLGALQSALDIDLAELMVACCVLAGPERTLARAVDLAGGLVSRASSVSPARRADAAPP